MQLAVVCDSVCWSRQCSSGRVVALRACLWLPVFVVALWWLDHVVWHVLVVCDLSWDAQVGLSTRSARVWRCGSMLGKRGDSGAWCQLGFGVRCM